MAAFGCVKNTVKTSARQLATTSIHLGATRPNLSLSNSSLQSFYAQPQKTKLAVLAVWSCSLVLSMAIFTLILLRQPAVLFQRRLNRRGEPYASHLHHPEFPVANSEQVANNLARSGIRFESYNEGGLVTDDEGIFCGGGTKIVWFKDPAGNVLPILEESK